MVNRRHIPKLPSMKVNSTQWHTLRYAREYMQTGAFILKFYKNIMHISTVYIRSFDEKLPFVYTCTWYFRFDETL